MKAEILGIDGKKVKEIDLPEVFQTPVDEKLIKRAVLSIESAAMQPKGPSKSAGRNYTAVYIGSRGKPQMYRSINIEKARLPRLKNRRFLVSGRVALVPHAVGGPKAHPPKTEKIWKEKINKKEKRKALNSAIAATAISELVRTRGHRISEELKLPIIVEKKFEELEKTKKVVEVLKNISLLDDVLRAKRNRKIRAGKGKKRASRYKTPKSVLIVVSDSKKIFPAARNIAGVDVAEIRNLNAKHLAPGAVAGRLTVWSEEAIKFLGSRA
ncbi:MAG: 50S ribosomal protein L4 [Candidatus Diapherotrites archaeon]|nr:50S ribosomal protein L4 [Candidatus Diapherotrites archaeon]